jgi:hypothetical protein
MAYEVIYDGKIYSFEDMERLCEVWKSSHDSVFNTHEVGTLLLACLENMRTVLHIEELSEFSNIFDDENIDTINWMNHILNDNK